MPTYQYACTECGHQLEAVQSFSDEPLTVCPNCEGRLRKVFSAVGVVFKGSGFYRTDSRNDSKSSTTSTTSAKSDSTKSDSAKSESTKSEPAKTESTKSESKPAATAGASSTS